MKFIKANSLMGDLYQIFFTVSSLSEQKKKELAEKIDILCRYTSISGGIDTDKLQLLQRSLQDKLSKGAWYHETKIIMRRIDLQTQYIEEMQTNHYESRKLFNLILIERKKE